MAFDPQCYELAEQFVNDLPAGARSSARVTELAQRIQDAIEDSVSSWVSDDMGRDEEYERLAARDRADGFERTGGRDWT